MSDGSGTVAGGCKPLQLALYVAGQTPKSRAAIRNLQRVCAEHLEGLFSIELVDLRENPLLAREHNIVAIPTLVRQRPEPVQKIVGDLSDDQQLLLHLRIDQD